MIMLALLIVAQSTKIAKIKIKYMTIIHPYKHKQYIIINNDNK